MEVILDDLNRSDFFRYGGVIKLKNGETITEDDTNNSILPEDIGKAYIGQNNYETTYNRWSGLRFMYRSDKKEISPKDPYGMKNLNFTCIEQDDERWEDFKNQRIERGFDTSELWNLDDTLAKFIYPRLKAFRDGKCSWPGSDENIKSPEDWDKILDSMVEAFEIIIYKDDSDWDMEKINNGLKLFSEYFLFLWT